MAFSKEVLVCEYSLIIDKESTPTPSPGAIVLNKPLDSNKEDYKECYKTATSLLLIRASIEDI